MPQDPLLVDQIQLEPGSGQTLLVGRDSGTGAIRFQDAVATGGVLLHQLASLRAITNVFIVGGSGLGAEYTTIQDALDAVPAAASSSNPYLILVMPGRYDETLNIVRDGVHLVGIGEPEIRSALESTPDAAGADHTIIISAQLGTIPLYCRIEGFKISNAHTNKACIRVVGAASSTLLKTGGLFLRDLDLRADSAGGNYTVYATTAGRIEAEGCIFRGSSALSLLLLQEMSFTVWRQCAIFNGVQHRYDTAQDQPDGGSGIIHFQNCHDIGAFSSLTPGVSIDCDGSGAMYMRGCTVASGLRLQLSGDQSHYIFHSVLGILSLLETVSVETLGVKHEGLLAANANAELDEDVRRGTVTFAAETSKAVTFDIPYTDADYTVSLELPSRPANDESPWVTVKATTGFTINFQSAQTMTVAWTATRN